MTPAAMSLIRQYQWPGIVRELENLLEMLVVMKEDGVFTWITYRRQFPSMQNLSKP